MPGITREQAEGIGGSYWTGGRDGDLERVYFNEKVWAPLIGLEVTYYGTDNVKGATLKDTEISNAEARRYLATKVFLDVATGNLRCDAVQSYIGEMIVSAIRCEIERVSGAAAATVTLREQLAELETLLTGYADAIEDPTGAAFKAKAVYVTEHLVTSGLMDVLRDALKGRE